MSRLLTPEDLYALKLCGDPRIAPDGTRLAFIPSEIDREAYEYRRSIWVVPTAGGAPRQFTSGPKDSAPRWSPDGSRLAFVRAPGGEVKPSSAEERAKGKGRPQIWLMPADGGEAQQLTFLRHGAGAPVWSPAGTTLRFAADTGEPHDADADDAAPEGKHLPNGRTIDPMWYRPGRRRHPSTRRTHSFATR